MKKFLVYLLVIIVAVSLGFSVFYLVRDNERISLSTTSIYVKKGDTFDVDLDWENKKAFSDYEVISSNNSIVNPNGDGTFTANEGGMAKITFRTSNAKYRNLTCTVLVGDGTISNPYYISTPTELLSIGNTVIVDGVQVNKDFTVDKCYQLISDINVASGINGSSYWLPIAYNNENGFTGKFDGNGHSISNANIDIDAYENAVKDLINIPEGQKNIISENVGFFSKIGVNGTVCGLTLNNVNISSSATNYKNVGTIAGVSLGTIERCDVRTSTINAPGTENVGGIVGTMLSTEVDKNLKTNNRTTARLDRSNANVKIGYATNSNETNKGASGNVGGLVGYNYGNIIVYSYALGSVKLNDSALTYGGLVGKNDNFDFGDYGYNNKYMYQQNGGRIKDCYTNISLSINNLSEEKLQAIKNGSNDRILIGGLIGYNVDAEIIADNSEVVKDKPTINRIIGNYYNAQNLNMEESKYVEDSEGNDISYIITKNFQTGTGKYTVNGVVLSNVDKQYSIQGKSLGELQLPETYISHVTYEYVISEEGGESQVESKVDWKFGTVWNIANGVNEGLPYLNYDPALKVSDEIYNVSDGVSIRYVSDLKNLKIDGHYILCQDLDLSDIDWSSDEWMIGKTKERAFKGSIESALRLNKDGSTSYFKITGLKTQEQTDANDSNITTIQNAAFIGYADGSAGGYLKNLTIENANILNGVNSAAFVASNGYGIVVQNADGTQDEGQQKGIDILNCNVYGSTIKGTKNVGAIAAINYNGSNILGSTVSNSYGKDGVTINRITNIILKTIDTDATLGGIVGKNFGLVDKTIVKGEVLISASSDEEFSTNIFAGGIAGVNRGTVSNSSITTKSGISVDVKLTCSVGGIVGQNLSAITNCKAITSIASDNETLENVYAGGIAGSVEVDGYINNCYVNSQISGYNAGGVVGYADAKNAFNMNEGFIDKNGIIKTVEQCAVDKDSVVTGQFAGGLVGKIKNAYVLNSYTAASLEGVSASSVKAGFCPELPFATSNNTVTGGFIERSYSICNFSTTNGENYGFTKSEILKDPIWPMSYWFKRTAGYVSNCAFANKGVTGNPKKPDTGNFLQDFADWWNGWAKWGAVKNPAFDVNDFKGTSGVLFNLLPEGDNNVWSFKANEFPTLNAVNNLEENITKNEIIWDYTTEYSFETDATNVKTDDLKTKYIAKISNGASFKFKLNLAPQYNPNEVVVKANGIELTLKDGYYLIDTVLKDYKIEVSNFVYKNFSSVLDDNSNKVATIKQEIVKNGNNPNANQSIIEYGDTVKTFVTLKEGYAETAEGMKVFIGDVELGRKEIEIDGNKQYYYEYVATSNVVLSIRNVNIVKYAIALKAVDETKINVEFLNEVNYGTENYSFVITPKEGYELSSLVVKFNGVELTKEDASTEDNLVYVIKERILKNCTIEATGANLKVFNLNSDASNTLLDVVFKDNATTANYGTDVTFEIKLNAGAEKKDGFKVFVNDVEVTEESGVYKILAIKENIVVKVEGVGLIEHSISLTPVAGASVEIRNEAGEVVDKVEYGKFFTFTVSLEEGYQTTAEFQVIVNDNIVTAIDNVYKVENVTEAQTIVINGVEKVKLEVTFNLPAGATIVLNETIYNNGETVKIEYGTDYTFKVVIDSAYEKDIDFKVEVNGVGLNAIDGDSYTITSITELQTIVVSGIKLI